MEEKEIIEDVVQTPMGEVIPGVNYIPKKAPMSEYAKPGYIPMNEQEPPEVNPYQSNQPIGSPNSKWTTGQKVMAGLGLGMAGTAGLTGLATLIHWLINRKKNKAGKTRPVAHNVPMTRRARGTFERGMYPRRRL